MILFHAYKVKGDYKASQYSQQTPGEIKFSLTIGGNVDPSIQSSIA